MGSSSTRARGLHVVTFVSRTGRRWFFASAATNGSSDEVVPLNLPPHIRAQLYAIGARTAWWYVGPYDLTIPGEASEESAAVVDAAEDQIGHLVAP